MVGAGAYALATNTLHISPRTSLLFFSFLPVIMLFSFYVVLPLGPLKAGSKKSHGYEAIDSDDQADEDVIVDHGREHEGLLSSPNYPVTGRSISAAKEDGLTGALKSFTANLNRARGLFFP